MRHASLYLYELRRRLDNRVSSSSALSEARRIFLRYLSLVQYIYTYIVVYIYGYLNFMRVLSLNWNYGMCSARYMKNRCQMWRCTYDNTRIKLQYSYTLDYIQCTRDRYRRKLQKAQRKRRHDYPDSLHRRRKIVAALKLLRPESVDQLETEIEERGVSIQKARHTMLALQKMSLATFHN